MLYIYGCLYVDNVLKDTQKSGAVFASRKGRRMNLALRGFLFAVLCCFLELFTIGVGKKERAKKGTGEEEKEEGKERWKGGNKGRVKGGKEEKIERKGAFLLLQREEKDLESVTHP